jgi:hypothetical protein
MDARHWFARASAAAASLGLKDWYLGRIHGRRGVNRYENYPVHYRSNTPARVRRLAAGFSEVTARNFGRVGQLDYYVPRPLRPLGRALDRIEAALGLPGSVLVVRAVK